MIEIILAIGICAAMLAYELIVNWYEIRYVYYVKWRSFIMIIVDYLPPSAFLVAMLGIILFYKYRSV